MGFCSVRLLVLLLLCLQNSLFAVLRRYSQGILHETYSKYECLLLGELIKLVVSAYVVRRDLLESNSDNDGTPFWKRLLYLIETSRKMLVLALIYGVMNILAFVALQNIGASIFTIFAQTKIFTTALFSSVILNRTYSWTQWRALTVLMLGVLLFSEPVWNSNKYSSDTQSSSNSHARPWLGVLASSIEVTMSGFAIIYFEKVIKLDPLQLTIWERNFQLALGSLPVYGMFLIADQGGTAGFLGGWSWLTVVVACLSAAGGLLVALSIKHGDSILKTLATSAAIVLSSLLDRIVLDGPLTPTMTIAGLVVILSICNYTFDATPVVEPDSKLQQAIPNPAGMVVHGDERPDEEVALIRVRTLSEASDLTVRTSTSTGMRRTQSEISDLSIHKGSSEMTDSASARKPPPEIPGSPRKTMSEIGNELLAHMATREDIDLLSEASTRKGE